MKGFIELKLQDRQRLIAISSITGITGFKNSCRISLNALFPDFKNTALPSYTQAPATAQHFDTEEGITLDVVKKMIEDAQEDNPELPYDQQ